ncbi:MAG: prepilin-type N-terminal cleavage/methylation domain-containing protein [Armatimonadetes bacterium]|nr:prepilin-type N-terminal cleavage/methylation domain-containing protein [Armatimonadota bacterium]
MRRRAFTFVEMMVVIMVLAMVAAIAFPKLSSTIKSGRVREYLGKLKDLPSECRNTAIRTGRTVSLVASNQGQLTIQQVPVDETDPQDLQSLQTPSSITLDGFEVDQNAVTEGEWQVRFYPDGTCDGARVNVNEGSSIKVLVIDAKSGRGTYKSEQEAEEIQDQEWDAGGIQQRA